MKHAQIKYTHGMWSVAGVFRAELCQIELADIFPDIDWSDHDQVIDVSFSHRRDTGFKTFHIEHKPGVLGGAGIYHRGDRHFLVTNTWRWFQKQGLSLGDTIYIRMRIRQAVAA